MWRFALVVIVVAGCAGDRDDGSGVDSLEAASNVQVEVTSGASISERAMVTFVRVSTDPCLTADGSFAGTIAGLPMTVADHGGYDSVREKCMPATLELVGATGSINNARVQVSDSSKTIQMTFASPSIIETRSATYVASSDGMVHYTWSHPEDLSAGARVAFTPSGEGPTGWSVQATVSGDDIAYQVPVGAPIAPGVTVIFTDMATGSMATCDGAAGCTYTVGHELLLH